MIGYCISMYTLCLSIILFNVINFGGIASFYYHVDLESFKSYEKGRVSYNQFIALMIAITIMAPIVIPIMIIDYFVKAFKQTGEK